MSEKRYEIRTNGNGEHWLFDNKYDTAMMISKIRANLLVVCNRLNEQQGTISQLEQENADRLGDKIRSLDEFEKCTNKLKNEIVRLQEENERLKHYKLYEDNKRLQTRIADLKGENEQLKQEVFVYKKAFQEQVQRCTL